LTAFLKNFGGNVVAINSRTIGKMKIPNAVIKLEYILQVLLNPSNLPFGAFA